MQRGQLAVWCDCEDRSPCRPIEVPIGGLNQPGERPCTVVPISERMQLCQFASSCDSENCAAAAPAAKAPAALESRSVEIPIGGLRYPCIRSSAVGAVRSGAKAVKCLQFASRRNLKDRAAAIAIALCIIGPAIRRRPVEIAVGGLHQTRKGAAAVSPVRFGPKVIYRRQLSPWRDLEHNATAVGSPTASCSVLVPIGRLHQSCKRVGSVVAVKAVQRRKLACWSDPEDGTTTPIAALSV